MMLLTKMPVERDGREVFVTISGYWHRAEPATREYPGCEEAVVLETWHTERGTFCHLTPEEQELALDYLQDRLDSIRGQDEAARELNEQCRREVER